MAVRPAFEHIVGEQLLVLVSRSINDFYFRVSVTDVNVGVFSMGKGLIVGLGATLLATAVPALEAASYRPRLALTRSVLKACRSSKTNHATQCGIAKRRTLLPRKLRHS